MLFRDRDVNTKRTGLKIWGGFSLENGQCEEGGQEAIISLLFFLVISLVELFDFWKLHAY